MTPHLASWNDTPTKQAIVDFVAQVSNGSIPNYVPPEARIAAFDNDGTLWCEKPMPIQADFILRRLAAMADQDPALRERQPWRAAYEKDYAWLNGVTGGLVLSPGLTGPEERQATLHATRPSPARRWSCRTRCSMASGTCCTSSGTGTSTPPRTRGCWRWCARTGARTWWRRTGWSTCCGRLGRCRARI